MTDTVALTFIPERGERSRTDRLKGGEYLITTAGTGECLGRVYAVGSSWRAEDRSGRTLSAVPGISGKPRTWRTRHAAAEALAAERPRPHGGARPGAGRPRLPEERRTRVTSFTLPAHVIRRLDAYAGGRGESRSAALAGLLDAELPELEEAAA